MNNYFKSIIDEDEMSVVICDLNHTIIYMNPAAVKNYVKWGGAALLGKNLLNCHNDHSKLEIKEIIEWFKEDKSHNRVYTNYNVKKDYDVYVIALRDENGDLIGYYEKHELRTRETKEVYKCHG